MERNQRLKKFVESKNIKQKEFADILDSTQQYVSALLNGRRKLGSNLLERIEEHFTDINIHWLLTGEGEMLKGPEKGQKEDQKLKEPGEKYENAKLEAMHQDLHQLAEGMTKNFSVLSDAMFESLKGQQKILKFLEQLDADKISKATGNLEEFLKSKS